MCKYDHVSSGVFVPLYRDKYAIYKALCVCVCVSWCLSKVPSQCPWAGQCRPGRASVEPRLCWLWFYWIMAYREHKNTLGPLTSGAFYLKKKEGSVKICSIKCCRLSGSGTDTLSSFTDIYYLDPAAQASRRTWNKNGNEGKDVHIRQLFPSVRRRL